MKTYSILHQDQKFTYTDHSLTFPAFATETLRGILAKWQEVFPQEKTLIQSRHGVPSLFVRFDCILSPDGEVRIYELQEGCAWVGYTGIANEAFREIRDTIVREEWPGLKLLRSDEQSDKDDDLWLGRVNIQEALQSPDPLIVRNRLPQLSNEQRAAIIAKSLRPVMMHNNKQYGVQLGWWKQVIWHESSHGAALPWHEAFVLKPLSGHGSTDIMIWKPDERAGRATKTQIAHALQKHGKMYLQPFIEPMRMDINGKAYNYIYRPYFIYSIKQRGWLPMHGVWTARPYPNLRIHGTSDTVSGPLLV